MPNRRDLMKGAAALPLALGAAALGLRPAGAQSFPTRNITIVVPFPPGGTADFAARPLGTFLAEKLGKNVVVENKGGAGGGVGHAYLARAEPDGHTIMTALPSLAVIPEANRLQGRPVHYETTDFVPLARMFADAPILAVKKDSPWKTMDDFLAAVKKDPGRVPYGTSGQFGTVHLAMEMFLNAANLKMLHVPYQGGGPAFNALLSDQVPVVPTLESIAKGQLDAGNVRALAQFGSERLDNFKTVPTLQEAGYPEVIYILWTGVFAPVKTPAHAQTVLRDAIREFMARKDTVERFTKAGSQVGYMDGPDFAKFLEKDNERLIAVTRKVQLT